MGRERGYGIAFDGIVFIGNTVTVGKYFGEGLPVETSVLGFPTYAGVNWYHNHPTNQSVEDFVKEAKAFADHDYVLEYLGGNLKMKMIMYLHFIKEKPFRKKKKNIS